MLEGARGDAYTSTGALPVVQELERIDSLVDCKERAKKREKSVELGEKNGTMCTTKFFEKTQEKAQELGELGLQGAESYYGLVETVEDALVLVESCRRSIIPRVKKRLGDRERTLIRSGSVFIFVERESGIKRWTDGKIWSPSRISGEFLLYRQLEQRILPTRKPFKGFISATARNLGQSTRDNQQLKNTNRFRRDQSAGENEDGAEGGDSDGDGGVVGSGEKTYATLLKKGGLLKRTISLVVSKEIYHLISYYAEDKTSRSRRSVSLQSYLFKNFNFGGVVVAKRKTQICKAKANAEVENVGKSMPKLCNSKSIPSILPFKSFARQLDNRDLALFEGQQFCTSLEGAEKSGHDTSVKSLVQDFFPPQAVNTSKTLQKIAKKSGCANFLGEGLLLEGKAPHSFNNLRLTLDGNVELEDYYKTSNPSQTSLEVGIRLPLPSKQYFGSLAPLKPVKVQKRVPSLKHERLISFEAFDEEREEEEAASLLLHHFSDSIYKEVGGATVGVKETLAEIFG